jgi:hypothetical protein
MLFWIGASELLAPFNPLLKFILVKTVVFLTFWQVSGLEGAAGRGGATHENRGQGRAARQDFAAARDALLVPDLAAKVRATDPHS